MSVQHDNELAAAMGGRVYRHLHPETEPERLARLRQFADVALAAKLAAADANAPKVTPSKAYRDL